MITMFEGRQRALQLGIQLIAGQMVCSDGQQVTQRDAAAHVHPSSS